MFKSFQKPTPAVTEPSPCRQLCDLSPEQMCTGCGRTLDEIRDWSTMSEQQKRECKERAEQRIQALFN